MKTNKLTKSMSIDGLSLCTDALRSKQELIDYLHENGATHSALMNFCDEYREKYKNELCWSYPISDGKHLGTFLVLVKEGILSLPYDDADKVDYELFCLEDACMFDSAAMTDFIQDWDQFAKNLRAAMCSMRNFLTEKENAVPADEQQKSSKIKRDTTVDLFYAALNLVKEKGCYEKAEAIMDYYLPHPEGINTLYKPFELSNYRFDFCASASFGGSEGIYIDCYIEGEYTEIPRTYYDHGLGKILPETHYHIATFKTLRSDLEAMQIMGELCGSLIYYASEYINKNINRYTPSSEMRASEVRDGD